MIKISAICTKWQNNDKGCKNKKLCYNNTCKRDVCFTGTINRKGGTGEMKVTDFGATVKGDETKLYTLTNKNGMEIAVSDYGATLVQVIVPDKEGKPCDVVLGYDEAAGYEEGDLFFGAIVGRSANRIGGASFELNGVTYQLEKNDNGNNLHSGMDFYNQRMWKVKETADDHITFELDSRMVIRDIRELYILR